MPKFNPYEGTAGLIDDVDVTISSAEFTYDPEYNDGNSLIARLEATVDGTDDEQIFKLSTGSGWEPDEKGARARREDGTDLEAALEAGKKVGFNKQCAYQRFLMSAVGAGAGDALLERGQPWEAGIWTGLRFHVERVGYKTVDGEDKDRLEPTAYLGTTEEKPAAKSSGSRSRTKAESKAEPKEEAKAAPAKAESSNGDIPVKTRMALKKLAKECDSHDEFVEQTFASIDSADEEPLLSIVMDESEEGLFAMANAE